MAVHKLPSSLWNGESICLPDPLKNALRQELEARGLFQRACENSPEKEVFGGCDAEETKKHFADRFKTSAARVAYVLSSPIGQFLPVSHDLLASIFDGSVAVLDIPCGSGGGLHGLLSTVCDLRVNRRLPRTPITVKILAADISPLAMEIHEAMLKRLKDAYSRNGIRVEWEHLSWDVQEPFSTTALMDRWLETSF